MTQILKGKPVADSINESTQKLVETLLEKEIVPTLAILRVGNKESDIAYQESAEKKARALGIHIEKFIMDEAADESDVLDIIKIINDDENIHGLLMLRPLPRKMNEDRVRNHVALSKDVDGITDKALGSLFVGEAEGFPPCTAEAAMTILDYYGYGGEKLQGKKATVIGRSLVVGKPVAMMLLKNNATVTICHSKTKEDELERICRSSDIIICSAGHIGTVKEAHVNGNQIIVDVGINFNEEGKMCGDADFDAIADNTAAITPVPGGVGSVTTALLMHHVVMAATAATAVSDK